MQPTRRQLSTETATPRRRGVIVRTLACTLAASALAVAGCALQEDLLNPDFRAEQGLPGAINYADPQAQTITIAFSNTVTATTMDGDPIPMVTQAQFNVVYIPQTNDTLAPGFDVGELDVEVLRYQIPVDGGFNIVLPCNVRFIGLGEEFGTQTVEGEEVIVSTGTAVILTFDDGTTAEYAFDGESLVRGEDVVCGQVIELTTVNDPLDFAQVLTTVQVTNAVPPGAAF